MASTDNFGNQIRDAVQSAVDSQDYSKLQATIEQSINAAAVSIGRGLAQAQTGFERAQAEYARDRQRAEEKRAAEERQAEEARAMELVYAAPAGPQVRGGGMLAGGIVATSFFLPFFLLGALSGAGVTAITFGALTAAGIALIVAGAKEIAFAMRFKKYRGLIGLRDHAEVRELALALGRSDADVVKDLRKAVQRRLFKQGMLDDREQTIIMTDEAKQLYLQSKKEFESRRRQELMAGSVSPQPSAAPLSADVQALLAEGEAYVAKIRLANEAIADPEVTRKIDQIEQVVRTIFARVEEHPEAAEDLGQLMNYYLPTTSKLLDAYRDLDAQPIQGENILKSKREIAGALDSLAVAFEKLLDQVFRSVAWDVSADVAVLHTVLAQEGLAQSPFDMRK
ncbi:MAG: 5-bromo-4-chloroindolyl phosphate hydrolysis family protein [Coriobacteriia bacterium]|nr:5-bromo-4-chloroindolyl phosphate hydrolysis family protein [Coriobacteriia bacterium]